MKKLLLYALPLALVFVLAAMLPAGAGVTPSSVISLRAPTPVLNGPIISGRVLNIAETISVLSFNPQTAGLQRPIGSFLYDRSGTAAYIKTGTLPTQWELIAPGSIASGGNSFGFLSARALALTGITNPNLTCSREDFIYITNGLYNLGAAGSGTYALDTGNIVGGQVILSSGATAGSLSRYVTNGSVFGRPDTSKFYWAARAAVTTAIDAQAVAQIGIGSGVFGNTLGFGACGAVSTTTYQAIYDSGGTCGGTKLTTGIAISATEHVWEMWGAGDNKIHFAVDFSEIAGSPVTQASSPTISLRPYAEVQNGTTAAARSVEVDWVQSCWSQT